MRLILPSGINQKHTLAMKYTRNKNATDAMGLTTIANIQLISSP